MNSISGGDIVSYDEGLDQLLIDRTKTLGTYTFFARGYPNLYTKENGLYALYPIIINLVMHINEPPYFVGELETFEVNLNETAFEEGI
jgi:hypothetical protein